MLADLDLLLTAVFAAAEEFRAAGCRSDGSWRCPGLTPPADFSPDGRILATSSSDGTIRLCRTDVGHDGWRFASGYRVPHHREVAQPGAADLERLWGQDNER